MGKKWPAEQNAKFGWHVGQRYTVRQIAKLFHMSTRAVHMRCLAYGLNGLNRRRDGAEAVTIMMTLATQAAFDEAAYKRGMTRQQFTEHLCEQLAEDGPAYIEAVLGDEED